jgi:acyl carrier protein
MDIRNIVLQQLKATVERFTSFPFPNEVDDSFLLRDFMLDSIAYTSLLVKLEGELGFIPLGILSGTAYPETIGELINAYAAEAATKTK